MTPSADTRHELNGRELASWGGFLRVYGVLARELDGELTTQHGITLSDYEVLLFLASTAERRMRMSELADSVLISQSGITRLVDRLTRRGLVKRERCSADRRGLFAVLTDDGLAKLREASPDAPGRGALTLPRPPQRRRAGDPRRAVGTAGPRYGGGAQPAGTSPESIGAASMSGSRGGRGTPATA